MELFLQDIVDAVGGECLNPSSIRETTVKAIETDSRGLLGDSLFVPLKGENFDGHEFISMVFDKGAIATLTQERNVVDPRLCTIYVKSTQKALLDLAQYYRQIWNIPVVGVTGSVGKTSTKEIIAAVLSGKFRVHKTEGNYNNEIGLPLTLFKLKEEHEVAVIEMGMNHFGEIHNLTMATRPKIGVITNIGTSHIENLGSREGILKAKLEMLEGLEPEGLLVVNGDNDLLNTLKNIPFKLIKYGMSPEHPYHAQNIKYDADVTTADIVTPKGQYKVSIVALGEHMIYNTLAAIVVAEHLGLTEEEILRGIGNYVPAKMRMHIETHDNGVTTINDAYNASPESMEAALKVLEKYPCTGKRIAVLGDMLEMGDYAKMLHEQVGSFACQTKIDDFYLVGPLAKHIYEGIIKQDPNRKALFYDTKVGFIKDMEGNIQPSDTVLFKASRGMKFEEMIEALGKVNYNEK